LYRLVHAVIDGLDNSFHTVRQTWSVPTVELTILLIVGQGRLIPDFLTPLVWIMVVSRDIDGPDADDSSHD